MRRIGALAGLAGLVALVSIGAPQRAPAQSLQLRDPASVPPSWQQFAKLVKYRFEEWTRADDELTRRLRTYVQSRAGHDDGPPRALLVKAWVAADGKVEKVDFPALNDPQATEDLRAILVRGNIGEPPPPDMLQPLQLRFSLNLPK